MLTIYIFTEKPGQRVHTLILEKFFSDPYSLFSTPIFCFTVSISITEFNNLTWEWRRRTWASESKTKGITYIENGNATYLAGNASIGTQPKVAPTTG